MSYILLYLLFIFLVKINSQEIFEKKLKKNYRILLISNMNTYPNKQGYQSKREVLYDILKKSKLFSEIKIVSLESINHFNELLLSIYDCVIYDFLDWGSQIVNPAKEIENYIKNGGNIIVTHDHVFDGLSDLLGIKIMYKVTYHDKVKIINFEHEIWNSYYNLNDWKSKPLKIALTHGNFLQGNEQTQRLMVSYDDFDDIYLSTRKIGMGNAIYWNAGHSMDITPQEKKLFINIIVWALKNNN